MPKTKKIESKKSVAEPKKISIRPLMGYLLVEPSAADTKTASGIILPESAQERPAQGTVVAVGEAISLGDGRMIVCPVMVGDRVVYKKWGG